MYDIYMKSPSDQNFVSIYQPGNESMRLISPKLTVEMGKAGSLEFGIPPTNSYYSTDLKHLRTLVIVYQDGNEIFRGRILNKKRAFNNIISVYAEGDLSYLIDSVQKAKKYNGKAYAYKDKDGNTKDGLFETIIKAHNSMIKDDSKKFEIGIIDTDNIENRDVILVGQSDDDNDLYDKLNRNKFNIKQIVINSIAEEWQTTYDYLEKCLLDYCGGYLRTRRGVKNGKEVTYIDWYKESFGKSSQVVEFAKNILDLSEEFNPEDAFSVLIPIGDENFTLTSKDPETKKPARKYPDPNNSDDNQNDKITHAENSLEIVDNDAVAKYGRIVKTNVFDGVTRSNTLLKNGIRYLRENSRVHMTIEVRAVDMHLVNPSEQTISVGDVVTIRSPGHSIDRSDLVCTKIEYDLSNPANTVYTFGNPKQTLTKRYRQNKKKQEASSSRSGGSGGSTGGTAGENNASENEKEFFQEWINYDPNDKSAHIDLKTLYSKIFDGESEAKEVSKTYMSFDSDASHAMIDLYAEHIDYVNTKKILKRAGINLEAGDDPNVKIFVENGAIGAYIKLTTETLDGKLTSKIEFNADNISANADKIEANAKNITINTNEINLVSKNLDAVTLKVDKLNIEGLVDITGTVTVSNGHLSGPIEATSGSTYYINGVQSGFSEHKHTLTCSSSGVVTSGTCTWGDDNSFKIADTKYFKDKVKALTVTSLAFKTAYDSNSHIYTITCTAKNAAGEELKSKSTNTGTAPYKAGYDAGFDKARVDWLEERPTGVRVHLTNGHSQFFSGWKPG